MVGSITDWVASKIDPKDGLTLVGRTPEEFLLVQFESNEPFAVAAIGVKDIIMPENVQPLLSYATRPQFIVNVPSKTLWSGDAISLINAAPAAFGTLGEIRKAAHSGDVPSYRNKNWEFFENAIIQHESVYAVTRIYDEVFEAHRHRGSSRKIALVNGYHVSAEDVRNARDRFGKFDIAVKKSGYGSVTDAAEQAAVSMGAQAVTFKGLMQSLTE
jgi:hypothetical protein